MYSFPDLQPVCSMSSSNCCFLTCIQVSQEAGKLGGWVGLRRPGGLGRDGGAGRSFQELRDRREGKGAWPGLVIFINHSPTKTRSCWTPSVTTCCSRPQALAGSVPRQLLGPSPAWTGRSLTARVGPAPTLWSAGSHSACDGK